jgi:hypothetical protein
VVVYTAAVAGCARVEAAELSFGDGDAEPFAVTTPAKPLCSFDLLRRARDSPM